MSSLVIKELRASISGREILKGVDLRVESGQVHVVMGPNGAGKSTLGNVLMGHPAFEVTNGSVTLDGQELLGLSPWQRARAGLFLAPQDPIETPGVLLSDVLREAFRGTDAVGFADLETLIEEELDGTGLSRELLDRGLNVDCSGGEKKRLETVQLAVLKPRFAVLDELDSGLDIDALRTVARHVEHATNSSTRSSGGEDNQLGVLVITHYRRMLDELSPDAIHVLVDGRIVESGGPELAEELERSGYALHVAEG